MTTKASTDVARRETAGAPAAVEQQPQSVLQVFNSASFKAQVAAALPKHIGVDSMMRIALTEVRMNADLQKCTVPSFMGALLKAAQSGLRPGMFGEGWIIARWNGKLGSLEAQFQPGYQGLAQLAYRSGEVADIVAEPVYKTDHFKYQLGSDPKIEHVPDFDADHHDQDIVAFYAVVKLTNGGRLMKVMPRRDVDQVRDKHGPHTKAGKLVGPWVDSYPAMGAKTVLIQCLKLAPKESERSDALKIALQAENDALFGDRIAAGVVEPGGTAADRVAQKLGVDADTGEVIDGECSEESPSASDDDQFGFDNGPAA
jgi:recombination protein RecT